MTGSQSGARAELNPPAALLPGWLKGIQHAARQRTRRRVTITRKVEVPLCLDRRPRRRLVTRGNVMWGAPARARVRSGSITNGVDQMPLPEKEQDHGTWQACDAR